MIRNYKLNNLIKNKLIDKTFTYLQIQSCDKSSSLSKPQSCSAAIPSLTQKDTTIFQNNLHSELFLESAHAAKMRYRIIIIKLSTGAENGPHSSALLGCISPTLKLHHWNDVSSLLFAYRQADPATRLDFYCRYPSHHDCNSLSSSFLHSLLPKQRISFSVSVSSHSTLSSNCYLPDFLSAFFSLVETAPPALTVHLHLN